MKKCTIFLRNGWRIEYLDDIANSTGDLPISNWIIRNGTVLMNALNEKGLTFEIMSIPKSEIIIIGYNDLPKGD